MPTIEDLTFYGGLELPHDANIHVINCSVLPNKHPTKISFPDKNYYEQIKLRGGKE